jgi:beta-mannosidase
MATPDPMNDAPHPPLPIQLGARQPLHTGWQLTATAPGVHVDPASLAAANLDWHAAVVPGTVAQSMATTVENTGTSFDAHDWWYRCHFPATSIDARAQLFFEGLATLAEIWLNGTAILTTRNMFNAHSVAIGPLLRAENELFICFRSLDAVLSGRHPRPRWKTTLVEQQALRWIRTTLLGRVPGWMPSIEPVGPWRGVYLEYPAALEVVALDLQTSARGSTGTVAIDIELALSEPSARTPDTATLCIGPHRLKLQATQSGTTVRIAGTPILDAIEPWWPHTHGTPTLYDCHIELATAGAVQRIDCGRIGFKEIALDRSSGRVQLQINGADTFCRGACWTNDDIVALQSSPERLRQTLQLLRAAGANMVRVGGTMLYESADFYALCDELGLLVWQDFMFASMDYPFEDPRFRDTVEAEIAGQLARLQKHPCIAVYCGNSEVEQQAAMVGLPASEWSHEFFSEYLPAQCAHRHRDIPYFPSTPCEGAMPFHVASGLAHYYSVSAYRQPLTDVKHAQVKFATECLCFANVPEPQTMALLHNGVLLPSHHPRWKERIGSNPANFDFEAIRDDYLKTLFKVDPAELRHCDLERYYALSRVVSGELMKGVFAQWRKADSTCGGGLIWFHKDFWPGAGWGFVDSTNRPKAAYWYLRRAWAPRALLITDEGLDGLQLQCVNDDAQPLTARVELEIYQHGRTLLTSATADIQVPARSALTLSAEAVLGRFFDTTYAYRFGPSKHDVVVARLRSADGSVLSEDFYLPLGLALPRQENPDTRAHAAFSENGEVIVTLCSEAFLQSVALSADDFLPDDNYFHLAPGCEKRIVFTPARAGITKFKVYLSALNSSESITLRAERT